MSKVNYIEIRDKKTGKVTTVELGGAGDSAVLEKNAAMTGSGIAFENEVTIEEFDTLWNSEFIMLNILTGSTEFTSQTLLKKVRQGTAGATPVMSMVFTQVQPTNETTINYAELTISRDTSDDYISSEFKMYDITGGGGTSDTAYVSDSTLYIEEGTTAGGGSSENILEIDVDFNAVDTENETVRGVLGALFDFFVETPTGISDNAYNNNTLLTILALSNVMNFKAITNEQAYPLPNYKRVSVVDLGITQTITYEQLKNVDGIRFHIVNPETQEKFSTLILKPTTPYFKTIFGVNSTSLLVTLNGDRVLNCVLARILLDADVNGDSGTMANLTIESAIYGI